MRIKVYKSTELTDSLWHDIITGFNTCFEKTTSVDMLKNHYTSTTLNYSYHALAFDEHNKLIGYNSILPMKYQLNGEKDFLAGVSGGTFILKEYRKEVFLFKDLMSALFDICKKDGIAIKLGVPNKNSFQYTIKIIKSQLIGFLPFYILPINISKLVKKSWLQPLDYILKFLLNIYLKICSLFIAYNNKEEKVSPIELVMNDSFYNHRFASEKYHKIEKEDMKAYYRLSYENNLNIAYLMDFREKGKRSQQALYYAINHILHEEKADAIMYVGTLYMDQSFLFKVSEKFVPQKLPLTINILEDNLLNQGVDLTLLDNWNFSLMNFDAR